MCPLQFSFEPDFVVNDEVIMLGQSEFPQLERMQCFRRLLPNRDEWEWLLHFWDWEWEMARPCPNFWDWEWE